MSANSIFIVGAGEFAEIAYEYFTYDSEFEVKGFCVSRSYLHKTQMCGLPVVAYEDIEQLYPKESHRAFTAIPASDMNRTRTKFYNDLKRMGYSFASYVSSNAFVWRNSKIGENTFIFEHNTIQPFVTIGNNCVLWSGNHVGHRTIVRDDSFITSHVVISGYCEVGEGAFIGVNATINDNIKIGKSCLVGAGSHIHKDTEPERIYIGSPARAVPGKSSFEAGI